MNGMRQNVFSGLKWEDAVGFARAVRIGDQVAVSGTNAILPDGTIHAPNDPYQQARRCLEEIDRALQSAGATMLHVVRTRIYLTDISHWPEVGRAHAERFVSVRPATTIVAVAGLIHPELLVEIEADAIINL